MANGRGVEDYTPFCDPLREKIFELIMQAGPAEEGAVMESFQKFLKISMHVIEKSGEARAASGEMTTEAINNFLSMLKIPGRGEDDGIDDGDFEMDPATHSFRKAMRSLKHPYKMAEALILLTMKLQQEKADVLGPMMDEIAAGIVSCGGSRGIGRAFPRSYSARIAENDVRGIEHPGKGVAHLHDMSCGTGTAVIARTVALAKMGFKPNDLVWTVCDGDWNNFAATYIQTSLMMIPSVLIWGDFIDQRVKRKVRNVPAKLFLHEEDWDDEDEGEDEDECEWERDEDEDEDKDVK